VVNRNSLTLWQISASRVGNGFFLGTIKNVTKVLAGSEGTWFLVPMRPPYLHEKARHLLRVTMKDKGHTAPSLALACGLSRSLIEKLMSNESKRPSPEVVAKIENVLAVRLWSSPSEFKARQARAEFETRAASIAASENIDLALARELARSRFPHLASTISISPLESNPERKVASVH
jgi:transcriptional regulator with XRE-family HTH domain